MFSRAHLSIDKSRRGALFSDLHVAPRAHENVKYEQPPGEAGVHCCTAQAARVSGQAQALHERPVHLQHTVRSGDTQMTKTVVLCVKSWRCNWANAGTRYACNKDLQVSQQFMRFFWQLGAELFTSLGREVLCTEGCHRDKFFYPGTAPFRALPRCCRSTPLF